MRNILYNVNPDADRMCQFERDWENSIHFPMCMNKTKNYFYYWKNKKYN